MNLQIQLIQNLKYENVLIKKKKSTKLDFRILIYKNFTLDEVNFKFNTFFVTFPSFEPFLNEILVKIWNTREISTMQQITILVPYQQRKCVK